MDPSKSNEIVFATHNENKMEELKSLVPKNITLLSLNDIGCLEEIPETSNTIEGNALQKARFVRDHYKRNCFADDTGLEVEALEGAPGVHSARYAGAEKDNEANIQKLLKNLDEKKNRGARFKTVIALCLEDKEFTFTGICTGTITHSKKGAQGFGYDPVFLPKDRDETFAQMTMEEKATISHRGKAVEKLVDFLSK